MMNPMSTLILLSTILLSSKAMVLRSPSQSYLCQSLMSEEGLGANEKAEMLELYGCQNHESIDRESIERTIEVLERLLQLADQGLPEPNNSYNYDEPTGTQLEKLSSQLKHFGVKTPSFQNQEEKRNKLKSYYIHG